MLPWKRKLPNLKSALNFQPAKGHVSQYNLMLFTLVLIYASLSHFLFAAQLQVSYCYLCASSSLWHESLYHLRAQKHLMPCLAGGCFHGIRCPLLTTFSKWYCSFGFIENYGHSHLSPYTKNFALKSSGRRYVCSLANKWPALGAIARAAALVQSGEDFCKAGYLSLRKEQADETPGITLISLQLLWESLCSTAFCQVDILVKLIYA